MGALIWLVACAGEDTCNGIWFADTDGDGYGGEQVVVTGCDPGEGFYASPEDCNDLEPLVNPGADEVCNGVDDDCSGEVDDDTDPASWTATWVDADGDGYGAGEPVSACDPEDRVRQGGDCDDQDASVSPATAWYADRDGDGYGDSATVQASCEQPSGYLAQDGDCDDLDAQVNPLALEVCDTIDNDCDGLTDDEDDSLDTSTNLDWYVDEDGDGYGAGEPVVACGSPGAYATADGDCDDAVAEVNPGEAEVCGDGLDNDCSGDAPECGWHGEVDPADADVLLTGTAQFDYFGDEIALADLDGDGETDVVVGESYSSLGTATAGAVHVWFGPVSGTDPAFSLLGSNDTDYLARSVGVADLDGDALDDVVAGADGHDGNGSRSGAAVFLYGANGFTRDQADDLPALHGTESNTYLGHAVRGLGDVDGDGLDEVGLGAPNDDALAANGGTVWVLAGSEVLLTGTDTVDSAAWASVSGENDYDYVGYQDTLAALGDLDGDGLDDVGVGAYGEDDGVLYLFHGAASLGPGTGDADASFVGTDGLAASGADAGDVDGDGHLDLILPQYGDGSVWIHRGDGTRWSGAVDVEDGDVLLTHDAVGSGFGVATVAADLDHTGVDDVFVGAPYVDHDDVSNTGSVYGFYGPLSSGTVTAADAGLHIAPSGYSYLGYSDALTAGDVDGDGVDDLLAGARYAEGYTGAVYLFRGEGW